MIYSTGFTMAWFIQRHFYSEKIKKLKEEKSMFDYHDSFSNLELLKVFYTQD